LSISAPDHVHHDRALRYWQDESADRAAFCRVTALALLRHLTNRQIMQHAVLSASEAWQLYEHWQALPEVVFLAEPAHLETYLERFARSVDFTPRLWTDAYLAAIALAGRLRLVSFDRDFTRFAGLDLLILQACVALEIWICVIRILDGNTVLIVSRCSPRCTRVTSAVHSAEALPPTHR
jgi:toxin-antitoxin system PIN domain toxin